MHLIEKIFSPFNLLILNIAIIIATVSAGRFFMDTGIVHAWAIFFIILAISRVAIHYHVYDPILEKFFHANILALGILAVSHVVEFVSFMVFHLYNDFVFANVANFYILSLLVTVAGAEMVFKVYYGRKSFLLGLYGFFMVATVGVIIYMSTHATGIMLDLTGPTPYLYFLAIFFLGAVGLRSALKMKKMFSITKDFMGYMAGAYAMIIVSAVFNILYESIQNWFNIPDYQVVYISHFVFYAALSFMFLAFTRVKRTGGVYDDIVAARGDKDK